MSTAKQIQSTDFEQADATGYEASEDYSRTSDEREFDGLMGDVGEAFFARLLEDSPFDYDHLGGIDEPDFLIEGEVSLDVKSRTVRDDNRRDLIVSEDIEDYPHDLYVLIRVVYSDEDWMDKPRYERDPAAFELIGIWEGETVVEVSEPFNPYSAGGRPSENNRRTVLAEYGSQDGDDWMDFAYFARRILEES